MAKDEDWWAKYDDDMAHRKKPPAGQGGHGGYGGYTTTTPYVACHETHKPLRLGDTGLEIHGGSCIRPKITDADIYIGFDAGMRFTGRHFPWTPGHELLYKIDDMHPPAEAVQFRKLVEWTAEQLASGAKVHCGCIGGHGRTGTFFAALVKHMLGVEAAIDYVREHYCKKAVETREQIDYLGKHFGVAPAAGSKEHAPKLLGAPAPKAQKPIWGAFDKGTGSGGGHKAKGGAKSSNQSVKPVQDGNSIWGKRCS